MRYQGRAFGVLCAATFLVSSIAVGPAAQAAPGDIVVNTSSDVEANDGTCSLREAIESARTDSASGSLPGECIAGSFGGTDTIIFEGVSAPIVLGGSELLINNLGSTIIDGGSGVVIDGNTASRVLRVFPTGSLTLRNLTIQNGEVFGSSGAGILISSSANVTIEDSTITANEAGRGGGILLDLNAELDLIRSTVSNNRGFSEGAGIWVWGELTMVDSTVSGNFDASTGGGIHIFQRAFSQDENGNTVGGETGTATIVNSTISGNTAQLNGGGIHVEDRASLTVLHSTITDNTAPAGAGIASFGSATTSADLTASIVADNNTGGDVDVVGGTAPSFISGGFNVIGDGGSAASFTSTGDLTNQVAGLGPLQDNGGGTVTHLPTPGSVAVDHISTPVANAPLNDQRGQARPQGFITDVGAVEVRVGTCAGISYIATDAASLNTAIGCFNSATTASTYTINIADDIVRSGASAAISNPVTGPSLIIVGNGRALDGDAAGSVLEIADATVEINGLTLRNGSATNGGAIAASGLANLTVVDSTLSGNAATANGGGMYSTAANVSVTNSTISGNTAGSGGGIENAAGVMTLNSSTVTENIAALGSGILVNNPSAPSSDVIIQDSIVAGNSGAAYDLDIDGVASAYTLNSYNILGDVSPVVSIGSTDSDQQDPMLGALADSGGPTATHLPAALSPAVDFVQVPSVSSPGVDQRGMNRPQGSDQDAGAVELRSGPCAGVTYVATDFTSLNTAIGCFNTAVAPFNYTIDVANDIVYSASSTIIGNSVAGASLLIQGNGNELDAAGFGSVLAIDDGSVDIEDLSVTGGDAPDGGGLYLGPLGGIPDVMVSSSTISGNTAGSFGGGIFVGDGSLELVNSTVSDNTGDGITNRETLVVIGSTITANSREGIRAGGFGSSTSIESSIVAANNPFGGDDIELLGSDSYVSNGNNILGGVEAGIPAFPGTNDLLNQDPLLAGLSDNGGPTPTHRPQSGSPAIDHVQSPMTPLAFDQRGVSRPQGASADAGSLETTPFPALVVLPQPCAVYDSTTATGSGLSGAFAGNELRTLQVTGAIPAGQGVASTSCVPNDATAVVYTISAIGPLAAGNLRLSESGVAANGGVVNYTSNGLNNANGPTVPIGAAGTVDVTANAGSTGVRLAVVGYYSPTGTLSYTPLTPCAVADSRTTGANPAQGAFAGPHAAGGSYPDIDVVGINNSAQGGSPAATDCGVPASADAVVVNVVAIQPAGGYAGSGFLSAAAAGTNPSEPTTPFADISLNNATATTIPLNGGQTISIDVEALTGSPSAHVRVIVLGFLDQQGDDYNAVNPCAAFDSRTSANDPNPATGFFAGKRNAGDSQTTVATSYTVRGSIPAAQGGELDCGVPASATAVLINLVAIAPEANGNLRAYATGSVPSGGVLNFNALSPALNNSNAVVVPLGTNNDLTVAVNAPSNAFQPTVHVRGIVLGYYE